MKSIKFDTSTIATICKYAETHTFIETCNRFTLKPDTIKRIAKKHNISFIHKPASESVYISSSAYSLDDLKTIFFEYEDIREDGAGNVICRKPDWYTGRKHCISVYLHNLVFCKAIGITEIPKGFMICHADGDSRNLNIDNLVLCTISCSGKLNQWKA